LTTVVAGGVLFAIIAFWQAKIMQADDRPLVAIMLLL
jgi:hypothetical protein